VWLIPVIEPDTAGLKLCFFGFDAFDGHDRAPGFQAHSPSHHDFGHSRCPPGTEVGKEEAGSRSPEQPLLPEVKEPRGKTVSSGGNGMAYFDLGAEHELGVASIDQQHRGLMDLVNLINDLTVSRSPIDELREPFDRLYEAAERHFLHEEELFAGTPYESAARHKREHAGLLLILKRFCQALDHQDLSAKPADYVAFMRTWLLHHIKGEDQQLGIHLKSLGIR
jgi:hemerythrin